MSTTTSIETATATATDAVAALSAWRRAEAARAAAEKRAEVESRDREDAGDVAGSNRVWSVYHGTVADAEAAARDRLGRVVADAFGLDPDAGFDRPRAVLIAGALVVTVDPGDDPWGRTCIVVEPGDVARID